MFEPTWKQFEKDIHTSDDPNKQFKALEAFTETRDKEMIASQKARDYEKSRKETVAKEKPAWVKAKREEEANEMTGLLKDLKSGGALKSSIIPMPGYLLVKPEKQEDQVIGGIFLPATNDQEPTTGRIKACGGKLVTDKNIIDCPVEVGDKVLFKKFAGMNILVMGEDCRLMQFSDMLGKLDD